MSKHDLDIVHSLEAETFLHMVTKGFYSNSYIGLWMYESIGREWDEMRAWAEGMKKEINPQTCTWSIGIWEWVYGIETNKTLQLEYRRQRILAKILETKPVNPEVIRRGVARITDCDVNITDFAGPYRFALAIHMKEDGDALPYESVREYVRMVKPSHLAAFLTWMFWIVINSKQLEQFLTPQIWMHWYIPFWKAPLLNSTKRYDLVLGIKNGVKFHIKEIIDTDRLYINISSCFNVHEKIYGINVLFRFDGFNFWNLVGSITGNHNMPLKITVSAYINVKQAIYTDCLINGVVKVYTEEKTGTAVISRATVVFWQPSSHTPENTGQPVTRVKYMAKILSSEIIGQASITSKRNLHYLNGLKRVDGSRVLNAFYGKESI